MNGEGVPFITLIHSFLNECRCFSNETPSPGEQNKKFFKKIKKLWLFPADECLF